MDLRCSCLSRGQDYIVMHSDLYLVLLLVVCDSCKGHWNILLGTSISSQFSFVSISFYDIGTKMCNKQTEFVNQTEENKFFCASELFMIVWYDFIKFFLYMFIMLLQHVVAISITTLFSENKFLWNIKYIIVYTHTHIHGSIMWMHV